MVRKKRRRGGIFMPVAMEWKPSRKGLPVQMDRRVYVRDALVLMLPMLRQRHSTVCIKESTSKTAHQGGAGHARYLDLNPSSSANPNPRTNSMQRCLPRERGLITKMPRRVAPDGRRLVPPAERQPAGHDGT